MASAACPNQITQGAGGGGLEPRHWQSYTRGVIRHRVTCPVLIGREDQQRRLFEAVRNIHDGAGQVVVISGEAGIGKSRLVEEARLEAERLGISSLIVQCFEQDTSIPYAPFVDLLQSLLRSPMSEGAISRLAPWVGDLVKLVPELEHLRHDHSPSLRVEPQLERHRLRRALTQFLTGFADDGLVLIVEDAHWSDDATLDVLLQVCRMAAGARVLLLVSCRSDEIHAELDHFLASLDRARLGTEFRLSRLVRSDVDAMVQAILDPHPPPSAATLTGVYALTDGNPFLVEETVVSILEGVNRSPGEMWQVDSILGLEVPRTIRDVVLRRSAGLSSGARRVLTVASVIGQRFDFALLEAITGAPETQLLDDLKELLAASLVVEVSADRFGFRHALTREAVYVGLLTSERRALHAEIAAAIERAYAGGLEAHSASLSYHFFEAGNWTRCLAQAQVASAQAEAQQSPRAAIENLNRAITAAAHLDVSATLLLGRRGKAHEMVGDFEQAREDFEAALASAYTERNAIAQCQTMLQIGLLWAGRDYAQSGSWLRRALAASQQLPDRELEARCLNRVGNWLVNSGSPQDALALHREALAIFEGSGDRDGVAETHDLIGMASLLAGDAVEALTEFDVAVDLFRAEGNVRGVISALTSRGAVGGLGQLVTVPTSGRTFAASIADPEEALTLARKTEWQAGQAYATSSTCMILGGVGDFSRALAAGLEALVIAEQIGHRQWTAAAHSNIGQTYVQMLAPAPALEHLVPGLEVARSGHSAWWSATITCNLALAHLLRSDTLAAAAVLRAMSTVDGPIDSLARRRLIWTWGRVLLAQGEVDAAADVARRLIESLPSDAPAVPALCLLKGEARLAAGHAAAAVPVLIDARDAAASRGDRPRLWEAHALLARAHRRLKRHDAARAETAAARAVIDALARSIEAPDLRDGFINAATAKLPAVRTSSSSTPDRTRYEGLTSRELAVAVQVAAGKSNREIAQALFIVEKTVEAHVSNSLGKLGFRSRSQLASWAAGRGLVSSGPRPADK